MELPQIVSTYIDAFRRQDVDADSLLYWSSQVESMLFRLFVYYSTFPNLL